MAAVDVPNSGEGDDPFARRDPSTAERLLPLVYEELRKLAARRIALEAPGQTLQATALVHEAWLRVAGDGREWVDRAHFFGAAAEAMRRILIERARRKRGPRAGGKFRRLAVDIVASLADPARRGRLDDLEAIDAALSKLARVAPRKAELVKLRYFAGLTNAEAAEVLGISAATACRDWEYARVWLYSELDELDSDENPVPREVSRDELSH